MLLRVYLHEDVVFGEQEGGDLGQLADGRSVCVRDDGAQLVQRIVQVVHSTAFARVDSQPHQLRLHLQYTHGDSDSHLSVNKISSYSSNQGGS